MTLKVEHLLKLAISPSYFKQTLLFRKGLLLLYYGAAKHRNTRIHKIKYLT